MSLPGHSKQAPNTQNHKTPQKNRVGLATFRLPWCRAFALTSAFPFSTKSFTQANASRGGFFLEEQSFESLPNGGFQKIGVPQNGWFIMEKPIKMDDLGIPFFLETPICLFIYTAENTLSENNPQHWLYLFAFHLRAGRLWRLTMMPGVSKFTWVNLGQATQIILNHPFWGYPSFWKHPNINSSVWAWKTCWSFKIENRKLAKNTSKSQRFFGMSNQGNGIDHTCSPFLGNLLHRNDLLVDVKQTINTLSETTRQKILMDLSCC